MLECVADCAILCTNTIIAVGGDFIYIYIYTHTTVRHIDFVLYRFPLCTSKHPFAPVNTANNCI